MVGNLLSFHSIGFPCERGGTGSFCKLPKIPISVSIQLVSPARGEADWEKYIGRLMTVVSIQLVSPARGEVNKDKIKSPNAPMFPFNWFPLREGGCGIAHTGGCGSHVSIQLVSPARNFVDLRDNNTAFPFNWFPLREGSQQPRREPTQSHQFPFNWFPLREGTICLLCFCLLCKVQFPFNWFPLREGRRLLLL